MTDKTFTIEVNGIELEARPGQMLIEVTDEAGIYIPRFCYHPKLSVAANCRMCLIEVENVSKPLPACATPVTDGMKVHTRSPAAIDAQKAVMEFLLINHPLDCPICDQGGECELQDLAMGFGRDISRFTERKRVVADHDLGPLISTDMTRCIHCTRCVRFGQEIAGFPELGTLGRGERTVIGTYIEKTIDHELSANIIDLCPVGALNNKPYRFSARAWEMVQRETIAPHDCVGAHLYAHVMNGRVKRVVPRACEAINEAWASDRDRFSYEGIYADDRADQPMLRIDGQLKPCSWEQALEAAADALRVAAGDTAALVSPGSTVEEGYLLSRLMRHIGSSNIDFRLRQRDFRDQDADPAFPWLGCEIDAVEQLDAILVIGSNLRHEVPLLAHRVRKAALAGSKVSFVATQDREYLFPVAARHIGDDLLVELDALLSAARARSGDARGQTAAALQDARHGMIWLGQIAMRHPRYAELRRMAAELASVTGAQLGFIPEGANAAGLAQAGVLPHRNVGGRSVGDSGKHVAQILAAPPKALLLLGVEPDQDCAMAQAAVAAMKASDKLIALTSYLGSSLREHADIVLPIGTFAETSGTYVNAAGRWQSFAGVASAVGESRPAWKVLRVLGNLLELPGCDYTSSEQIRDELRARVRDLRADNALAPGGALGAPGKTDGPVILDVPMYSIDAVLRRATALQQTREGRGNQSAAGQQQVA